MKKKGGDNVHRQYFFSLGPIVEIAVFKLYLEKCTNRSIRPTSQLFLIVTLILCTLLILNTL